MTSKLRRFEILFPLQFNDGREVPPEWLVEAVLEIVKNFGALSYETQNVEGHWSHKSVIYRDTLIKLVVDVSDSDNNRLWMRNFKALWKVKLEQLDLWLVSYEIDVE